MAKQFTPDHLPASAGRAQTVYPGGWTLHAGVEGNQYLYPAEAALAAGAGQVTLAEPVRTIVVYATAAAYLAKTAAALAAAASGENGDRIFVPAGARVELPWYQDEVNFKAVAGGGTIYVEGRI